MNDINKSVIVLDIGATNIRCALACKKGLIKKIKEKTNSKKLIPQIKDLIVRITKSLEEIDAIGIAIAGQLDLKKGIAINLPNLEIKHLPIRDLLYDYFKKPIFLINDCTAAVLGETTFGSFKNTDNVVYVSFGSGIGGGAIVNGTLLMGKDGNALEIGHMTVDLKGSLTCSCGRKGHWEASCSGKNIPNFAKFLINNELVYPSTNLSGLLESNSLTSEILFKLAKSGDKSAIAIIEHVGKINTIGIGNIIDLLDPDLIIIGGSVALNNPDLILTPIKRNLHNYCVNRVPRIVLASLGEDSTLLGVVSFISSNM